jgi:hypothetical protein
MRATKTIRQSQIWRRAQISGRIAKPTGTTAWASRMTSTRNLITTPTRGVTTTATMMLTYPGDSFHPTPSAQRGLGYRPTPQLILLLPLLTRPKARILSVYQSPGPIGGVRTWLCTRACGVTSQPTARIRSVRTSAMTTCLKRRRCTNTRLTTLCGTMPRWRMVRPGRARATTRTLTRSLGRLRLRLSPGRPPG